MLARRGCARLGGWSRRAAGAVGRRCGRIRERALSVGAERIPFLSPVNHPPQAAIAALQAVLSEDFKASEIEARDPGTRKKPRGYLACVGCSVHCALREDDFARG